MNIINKSLVLILNKALLIFLLMSILPDMVMAQDLPGCTDPKAKNYNPLAQINDGSCIYKTTIYNPPFKYLLPDEIKESSGLIYYDNALLTINDSGNNPIIYKFNPENGKILQRIQVSNVKNTDWEALAQDEQYIYVGDIGNNSGSRKNLRIHIIDKQSISSSHDTNVMANSIIFKFDDYPDKRIKKKKKHNFDCEAMICLGDSLYLFSKNRGDQKTKLYRLPKKEGDYEAEHIGTFNSKGLVTGADYNKNRNELILIGYTNKTWQPFIWLLFDFQNKLFFSGNKRRIDMLNIPATQTEAIAYTIDKNCVITSEGHPLFSQTAYDLNTGKWTGISAVKDTLESKNTHLKDH
jgi:hypothetical protein